MCHPPTINSHPCPSPVPSRVRASPPGHVLRPVSTVCSSRCSSREVTPPATPPVGAPRSRGWVRVKGACMGWPGWAGSVTSLRADPNLNWASVESMMVMSQSQVGLKWYSRYSCTVRQVNSVSQCLPCCMMSKTCCFSKPSKTSYLVTCPFFRDEYCSDGVKTFKVLQNCTF